MKKIILPIFAALLGVSCSNTDEPQTTVKNDIKVKVYSVPTWNSATNKMDTVAGATVLLISDSATVSATTDSYGVATFSDVKENGYHLVASKGDLSNLINKTTVDNKTAGILVIGVYTSQADIESSAYYSNSMVGGPKLADMNGDGIISNNDIVFGAYLDFEYQYKDVNADGIIDLKDLSNGSLIQIDRVVEKNIFIGK